MTSADLAVVIVYLLIVFGVGAWFTRRAHSDTTQYFLSGRLLPWWVAGTSMVATSFSCDTPLYVTQLVRDGGISLNWQWWSFGIGGLFSAFLLARLWRRAEVVTDLELCEIRYGPGPGAVLRTLKAAWMALIINTIGMSWVMLAMAKIIAAVWGGPQWTGVLIAAVLAVSYSFLAGFWGVVVTDIAQFVIALAGAVILAIVAVDKAGGIGAITEAVPASKLALLPAAPGWDTLLSGELWSGVFGGFVVYATIQWWANINADGGGKVIQRMSAARSEGHAFGATLWFNIAHYALRTWPWIIAALASLVLYPDLADDEMAYPQMIVELLPAPWTGFLIAGLVAAFMSTIDTQLNWGASYLTHDLYRRWLAPDKSEKHYLWAAKGAMLILIAVTGVIATLIDSVTEAFKFLIAFGAGTGPVLILRWFWWRINAWSEIIAMVASTAIASTVYLVAPDLSFPLRVVAVAAGSAVLWVPGTFLTRPTPAAVLRVFVRRTRPPGAWREAESLLSDTDQQQSRQTRSIRHDLLGWLGGMMLTFGLMFAIGHVLFLRILAAGVSLALALIGGWVVLHWWRASRSDSAQT